MVRIFQVDAFTDRLFGGNPAAVVPLDSWLDDRILQSIAAENNLAETAFIVRIDGAYELRWFTPASEVALCGHATLATAHVLVKHLGDESQTIDFYNQTVREIDCSASNGWKAIDVISVYRCTAKSG